MLLVCLAPRLRRPLPATYPVDFHVYYAAAKLVRQGQAAQMYTGADTGANPQKLIAPEGSPIWRVAHTQGVPFVGLYVYPPLLADLLVPFSLVGVHTAALVWLWVNFLFLLLTAGLLTQLLQVRLRSWPFLAILLATLSWTPVMQCLHDGQITILLLLLWVLGLVLYRAQRTAAAAVIFALATAIKLTPALVLLPLLLWRRWRFVVAYLTALLSFALLCLWIDGWAALAVYFSRVLPAMSAPLPVLMNFSLAAAAAHAFTQAHTLASGNGAVSLTAVRFGRAVSSAALAALLVILLRRARSLSLEAQVQILGLLGLVAPLLSPVSWFHAYATALVAFALLWRQCFAAWRGWSGWVFLVSVTALTLLLGSALSENLLAKLAGSGQNGAATAVQFGQMLAAFALALYGMHRAQTTAGARPPRSGGFGSADARL